MFVDGMPKCLVMGIQGFEKGKPVNLPMSLISRAPRNALLKLLMIIKQCFTAA